MKNHLLYSLLIGAAFSFSSCDEDFDDIAAPQIWPQEEAITIPGFSASAVESVNLATAEDSVVVFNAQSSGELPEGTSIANYRLALTPSPSENDEVAPVLVAASAEGKVASKDLQGVIEQNYGKRPVERSFNATLYADLLKGEQATLLTAASFVLKAVPKAPFISEGYYIVGDHCGWNMEGAQAFVHSDKDVYDDPIFTLVFTTSKNDSYWKIIPQENMDAAASNPDALWNEGVVGVAIDGDPALEGQLINNSDAKAGKISKQGMYKMTLNMMEYTYKLEELNFAEYIYEVGNNNQWGTGYALHSPNFDGIYHAAMYLVSGFKFRSNASDWKGSGNWGWNAAKEEGVLINDAGSGNIEIAEDGFYSVEVNLAEMTYTLIPFEQLGIIGDGQPGGWEKDTPLVYNQAEKCWVADNVVLTAGKSIKFRTLNDWNSVDYGGSLDNLIFKGDNIVLEESGTFTVKLYLETSGKFYADIIKK